MKDKPQMIRASIDSRFLNQYIKMLIPAIQRRRLQNEKTNDSNG
ncbi:MAG: hypothetical protein SOZ13_00865 [Enterococcus avium]|nr:hypothetical protein [Enterococcus avium]MDY4023630.1 hypothetical protein [Enterococcus avium]